MDKLSWGAGSKFERIAKRIDPNVFSIGKLVEEMLVELHPLCSKGGGLFNSAKHWNYTFVNFPMRVNIPQ